MGQQTPAPAEPTRPVTITRRAFLASVAGVGAGALAGCPGSSDPTASVLAAGSLARVFENVVGPAFGEHSAYDYQGEFHGSNAVMRMVADEQKRPDVVVSADASLLRERLQPEITTWDVAFASNAVVIAYDPRTQLGSRLDSGERWDNVLTSTDAAVGRTDPDLDPLGYRAVQLFELAARYYDRPELAARLRANTTVDPGEAQLLAGVEAGDRAAAIAYRNMAVDHGLAAHTLPPELNFAEPTLADHYAQASYTSDEGRTIVGTPIVYNATVPGDASRPEAGRAFVGFLAERPDLLTDNGLVVPESVPRGHGSVPEGVLP
ncbi:extracellular solute-binding protein [Halorhabdus rudnickae]|uniref:extracellular solute-binding protein n=1 Tax=Halorhabdus rudnickae TaxID=1775544 RepID=UPI0010840DA1|nr:extracellular solute-binding protein [Halorhabdus rudnickae]